jgi:hypothetical protein
MGLDDYTIKAGTTSVLLLIHARTPSGGDGATGLAHDTAGAVAAYVREGNKGAHRVDLVAGTVGVHAPGSFVEVDPDLVPGIYQFGAPDELLAEGSARAVLMLRFPGMVVDPVEVSLVAYDPQDADRLGMVAIGPEGRIKALRGAFPRLTQRELEEVMARKGD